jgi:hypothetical protein
MARLETANLQTDISGVTLRVGRSQTRRFEEIQRKDPLATICFVEMRGDRPEAENVARVRALMDIIEAGMAAITAARKGQ